MRHCFSGLSGNGNRLRIVPCSTIERHIGGNSLLRATCELSHADGLHMTDLRRMKIQHDLRFSLYGSQSHIRRDVQSINSSLRLVNIKKGIFKGL